MSRRAALPALVCLGAAAALAPLAAVPNGFSYDDASVVENNAFVADWRNLPGLFSRFYFAGSGELSYRPVVTFTYFLDHALWRGAAPGGHLTNLLLHVFCALALRAVLAAAGFAAATAWTAALLFAAYPLHAAAVCSIGFREDALMAAFLLASLAAALRAASAERPAGWTAAACALALLSMFSKETGVVAPALAAWLLWGRRADRRRAIAVVLALAAAAGAYAAVRFGVMAAPGEAAARRDWSGSLAGPTAALRTLGSYAALMAWPVRAGVAYPAGYALGTAPAAALLAAFALAAAASRLRGVRIGAGWALLALAPASNLAPIGAGLANRFTYLPAAGLCLAAAALASGRRRALGWCAALAYAAMLSHRCFFWADDFTLWRAAYRLRPDCRLAEINIAVSYDLAGRDGYAERLYESFLRREPRHAKARFNLARLLQARGEWERAEREYRLALDAEPDRPDAAYNLASLYLARRDPLRAARVLLTALRRSPNAASLHEALGRAWAALGRPDAALAAWRRAEQLAPANFMASYRRGLLLARLGRRAAARRALERALRIAPGFQPARDALRALDAAGEAGVARPRRLE